MSAHLQGEPARDGRGGSGRLRRAAALPAAAVLGLLSAAGILLAPTAAQAATATPGVTPGEGTGPGWCSEYGVSGVKAIVSYDNVWACGPNQTKGPTPFDDAGTNGTASFQCVELVERFLWAIYGLAPIFGSNVDGAGMVSLYNSAHPSIPVGRPGPSSLPQPGDVISFSPGGELGSAGHTAVVVSGVNSSGNFTIMSENWGTAGGGEETVHIDLSGAHNGQAQLQGSSNWNTSSFLETAGTRPSATAQLVFDDYIGTVYSVQVAGVNQNGQYEDACFSTPKTVNLIPSWWWAEGTSMWPYTSDNCTTGQVYSFPLTLTDSATSPPYHCQEDLSPYTDWNPGSNWQNCAINPPPKGVWYGYATSSFIRTM